jgi:hypothetical protein
MNPKIIFDFIAKKNPKYNLRSYIGSNPRLVQFMDNPTEEQKKHLLRNHPELYYTIKNPSIELQLLAIRNTIRQSFFIFTRRYDNSEGNTGDLEIDRWFDLDSYEIQLAFVRIDGTMIAFIDNPSEEIQKEAVIQSPQSIQYIQNPTEKVQMMAVTKNGFLIKYIENPSENVQLYAIEKDINAFFLIDNPTEKVKKRFEYLTGPDNNDF